MKNEVSLTISDNQEHKLWIKWRTDFESHLFFILKGGKEQNKTGDETGSAGPVGRPLDGEALPREQIHQGLKQWPCFH